MLVDLGRNDVGRVSEVGSVQVTELMDVRRYSHVMHIESTVVGHLAEGRRASDALRAIFPAGTLSGAPKVRAMEIIDELETTKRGPYGGAVGYLGCDGNLDTCITIRTIVCQRRGGPRAGRRGHRGRLGPGDRVRGDPEQGGRALPRDRGRRRPGRLVGSAPCPLASS